MTAVRHNDIIDITVPQLIMGFQRDGWKRMCGYFTFNFSILNTTSVPKFL